MRMMRRSCHFELGVIALALGILAFAPVERARGHEDPDNSSGTFYLDWTTDQVEATMATGIFQTLGLRVDNDPSRARVARLDGEQVLTGIALGFAVRDSFGFDLDETVQVEVELQVDHLREFYYAWDKNGTSNSLAKFEVPEGLRGWQTFTLSLDRARFANRGFAYSDFVISSGIDMSSQLLFIRSINFTRASEPKVQPESGTLQLLVKRPDTEELLAAQVGLYDESGRIPLPSDMAIELQWFDTMVRHVEIREELGHLSWPHPNRYSMYVDGYYQSQIPEGKYTLVVAKGPEYPLVTRDIEVKAGGVTAVVVELPHLFDMPERGWYSGDVHNHFARANPRANANHMVHARAHDLHMHWLYALGNSSAKHFEQYAWGQDGHYREKDYFLGSGQEDPRTDYLGHVLAMGHDEWVRFPSEYLLYDLVSKAVHEKGGIFGVAHMDFPQFQQQVALAMLTPLGEIDFVEVLQYHAMHTRDWYAFLNLGFRLPAAAGSDWPYMSLPGSVRTYVKIDGEFTPDKWNEGLKAGRTFVSNGPMLSFTVNGEEAGAVLSVPAGETLTVKARAEIDASWDQMGLLELVANGEVIEVVESSGGEPFLELEYELAADESQWIAVRAFGKKEREIVFQDPYTLHNQAHSSPVYVEAGGQPTWVPAKAPSIAEKLIGRLEAFKTMEYEFNDNEAWESPKRTEELVSLLRPKVNERVDDAIVFYRDLVERIEQAKK
jgi:hypothetical protein